jgi:hypothetical protein
VKKVLNDSRSNGGDDASKPDKDEGECGRVREEDLLLLLDDDVKTVCKTAEDK